MIQVSNYALIRGLPIMVSRACTIRQPRLVDIDLIGHERYQQYLSVMLLQKAELLGTLKIEDQVPFQKYSVYQIAAMIPELRSEMIEAFSFFMTAPMQWTHDHFEVNGVQLTPQEMDDMASVVLKISYIERDTEDQHVFASERARQIWEKCQKGKSALRKAKKQDANMELSNLIGAICAKGYGYTLLNIGHLTVYQIYDQFSRMNVNVQMDVYSTRWAAWGKDDFDVSMWFKNITKKEG